MSIERVWLVYKQEMTGVCPQKVIGDEVEFPWPINCEHQVLFKQLLPIDQQDDPIAKLTSLYPYEKPEDIE